MEITFGEATDHDVLETVFGWMRGYIVRVSTLGTAEFDAEIIDVTPDGQWLLTLGPVDPDGDPVGVPLTIDPDLITNLHVY